MGKNKKGFTLIELMVVILIVAILAAVAIPIMRGRIDAAKWSEGKAGAGTIATSIRALCAEKGDEEGTLTGAAIGDLSGVGLAPGDLDGTYFMDAAYGYTYTYTPAVSPAQSTLAFVITVTAANGRAGKAPSSPATQVLSQVAGQPTLWNPVAP